MDSDSREHDFDRFLGSLRRTLRWANENWTDLTRVGLVVAFVILALLAVHLERTYMPGSAWPLFKLKPHLSG